MNEKNFIEKYMESLTEDQLYQIVYRYLSDRPAVLNKIKKNFTVVAKEVTKTKKTKGKQNEKAKENDNVVSIATDDSTD